tara:strand:+ start:961 stop:3060 length:2100 start_codon:yes stop_codon:yes gene_type:complete
MRTAKQLPILLFISVLMGAPKTIAISYFDNTSGIEKYNPLSKGLADMLITDLSNIESIQIVEREKLESLLKEIELGDSKFIDPNTAQSLGKGLGADYILTGAFLSIDPMMRIDSRIMEVSTGKIIGGEEVTGPGNDFFSLEKKLASLLIERLELDINFEENTSEIDLDAVLDYSEAIDLDDKGLKEEASKRLKKIASEFPDFKDASSKLEEIRAWLQNIKNERSRLIDEMVESSLYGIDTSSSDYPKKLLELITPLMSDVKKYNTLLKIAERLGSLDKRKLALPAYEGSPITYGETAIFYQVMALNLLRDDNDRFLKLCQDFMVKYPTSMYFASVQTWMDTELKKIEEKEKVRKEIENELPLYRRQFEIAEIYYLMEHNHYDGEWPKNEKLYNKIKQKIEKTIFPIINDDWSTSFSRRKSCFREGYNNFNHMKNQKVLFLIEFRRLALANNDPNTVDFIDKQLSNYEEFLFEKDDSELIEDFYSKMEKMEKYSKPFDSRLYKDENTIAELEKIKTDDRYRKEEYRMRDYIKVYDRMFEISYINKDFESYETLLKQYKNDSFLKERKQHRREYFKLNKQFKEQKAEFDERLEYLNNYEKTYLYVFFSKFYSHYAHNNPDIVIDICLDLLNYTLDTSERVEVCEKLFDCSIINRDSKTARMAMKEFITLKNEVEKTDDKKLIEKYTRSLTRFESSLESMPD